MAEALKDPDGMVQYLGWFQSTETKDGSATPHYNLVLELGEMDLLEVFSVHSPPMSPATLLNFWERMRHICFALKSIHQLMLDHTNYNA